MDYVNEVAKFFNISISQVCLGILSTTFLGSLYAARKPIAKRISDEVHEWRHRNFFDRFTKVKEVAGKKRYPKTRWIRLKVGKKVIKRAFLEVKNLYANPQDIRLGEWSAEFETLFRHSRMTGAGEFLLSTDILAHFDKVHEEDLSHSKSSKEYLAVGLQENGFVCRLPTFTGLDGHTRIASQSGHGKTYLVARMIAEAQRQHPNAHCLLVTSKGAGLVGRIAPTAFSWLNPSYDLAAIRDTIKELLDSAYQRLKRLEESRSELSDEAPVLIVIDEAKDILTTRTGKPQNEDEAMKQEITNMLEQIAAKMRSANYHIVIASQQSNASDYPSGLRDNVANMIVGKVDPAFYPVLLRGIDASRFDETLARGDWWVSTSIDAIRKVRVVYQDLKCSDTSSLSKDGNDAK